MTAIGAKILHPETLVDPYEFYALLREEQPAAASPMGYLVTRYDDIRQVLRDTQRFSSRIRGKTGTQWGDEPSPEIRDVLATGFPEANTMVTSDPPAHGRFRSLASKAFRPGRVREIEDSVRGLAIQLVEEFADAGVAEFLRKFAVPLPLMVIADALGVRDDADLADLERWSYVSIAPLSGLLTEDERVACARGRVEAQHYFMRHIRARIDEPSNDVISDLVHAEIDGDHLDELEVLSIVLGLLVAGNESSRALFSNGMAVLSQRPDIADRLRAAPELVPQFVEEMLRYDAPVQMQFRVTTENVEVGGMPIPKGSRVALVFGSGNHDASFFRDGEEFELDRERPIDHLAFGYGEHHCLGAALARAELKVGFMELLGRLDDIHPARGDESFRRTTSATLRGFTEMHLAFVARHA